MNDIDGKTRLRAIWSEVLHGAPIDDADRFLDRGGDSIAAVQCVTTVANEFGVELPLHVLFLDDTTFGVFAEIALEAIRAQKSRP